MIQTSKTAIENSHKHNFYDKNIKNLIQLDEIPVLRVEARNRD